MSIGDDVTADGRTSVPNIKRNAHMRPPEAPRNVFKKWHKSSSGTLDSDRDLIDTVSLAGDGRLKEHFMSDLELQRLKDAYAAFMNHETPKEGPVQTQCYEVTSLPGLFIYPSLYPLDLQIAILERLLHRDLNNPNHKTNLHLHYYMPGACGSPAPQTCSSFFDLDPNLRIEPRDPAIHKPLSVSQMLERKLRWVTLGGQYDWTQKVYPDEAPPQFPVDIANLLRGAFPSVDPQAAILNFYTPGDTLSLHRDVSEECDRGLLSLSIGCEALFMVANTDGSQVATIRLHSGDMVLMSGDARYAWHAVPKVVPNTCPPELQAWPAMERNSRYGQWLGWLKNKRINLNVRQMREGL